YYQYKHDAETKKLVDDFLISALKIKDQKVHELIEAKQKAEMDFFACYNMICPIAMGHAKERKQKIDAYAHDLLVMQANLRLNIPTNELFTEMSKYDQKILQQRPNHQKAVNYSNQLANFVQNQIISAGVEAQKIIREHKSSILKSPSSEPILVTT